MLKIRNAKNSPAANDQLPGSQQKVLIVIKSEALIKHLHFWGEGGVSSNAIILSSTNI